MIYLILKKTENEFFQETRIHEIWEIKGYWSRTQEYMRYGKYKGIFKNKKNTWDMGNTGVFSRIQEYMRYGKKVFFSRIQEYMRYGNTGVFSIIQNTWDMENTGVFSIIQEYMRYGKYRGIFSFAYNGPTNQNNLFWFGGSKLHSKL